MMPNTCRGTPHILFPFAFGHPILPLISVILLTVLSFSELSLLGCLLIFVIKVCRKLVCHSCLINLLNHLLLVVAVVVMFFSFWGVVYQVARVQLNNWTI